jgi:hypothetical protein
MDVKSLGKKLLVFVLRLLFAIYEAESDLLLDLVAEVRAEGLDGEEARREVFRRFRQRYGGEIRDSLLNMLIEAAVVAGKG